MKHPLVRCLMPDGNTATFNRNVNGVNRPKAIARQVFRTSGTVCQ